MAFLFISGKHLIFLKFRSKFYTGIHFQIIYSTLFMTLRRGKYAVPIENGILGDILSSQVSANMNWQNHYIVNLKKKRRRYPKSPRYEQPI